ncbi:NRDE protein-domain-containing protein [Mycena haematopus]|nr:NRDE protein-domain-containing protein [Mycena haematopus]
MCVAFWTLDHPDYALILCNNRDEYLARPALAAAFHSFGNDASSPSLSNDPNSLAIGSATVAKNTVLSGRDVQAGGTWLGLAPQTGRVALLTNITESYQVLPSSRGALAPAFLLAQHPRTPLAEIFPQAAYAGFNLLVLEAEWEASASTSGRRLHFPHASLLSNGGAGGQLLSRPLRADERASGGLSNGLHVGGGGAGGGEAWPKVVQGRALFDEVLRTHDAASADVDADAALAKRLFALLRTTAAEPVRAREDLRRTICVEPFEIVLTGGTNDTSSSLPTPPPTPTPPPNKWYGTRTASVLLVRRSGEALFVERDVWRVGRGGGGGGVELYQGGAVGGSGDGEGEGDGERVFRVRVSGAPA